ncbi:MAG: hypothetical protein AW11_02747 [Candidatus Accumulibacter regalis]|jgi:carbon monoxide dehydrogenase subunit G|uniref:Ribosome association toxin RatA n=2 Tax=Candidatus Accumulibacter TaxID=327159 RepID=A0A011QCX8_ACCRE|nr:MAG: hypothetical protein AW11_02747 [Candidatus Accumulibacter regalis]
MHGAVFAGRMVTCPRIYVGPPLRVIAGSRIDMGCDLPMPDLRRAAVFLLLLIHCVAFAAEPEIRVAIDKVDEAFLVDATLAIPVPLPTAWAVLTDFDNMVGILSNLTLSKIVRRDGNSVTVMQKGTARYGIFSYAFASVREVQLEPMKRVVAIQVSGNAKRFQSEMRLSETGSATEIRYHAEIVPASGIARTFGGPFVQHEVEEQLALLAAEMIRRKAAQ